MNLMTDEQLVEIIQKQFENYRKGGSWKCDCGFEQKHNHTYSGLGKIVMRVTCPNCEKYIERFETKNKNNLDSIEFEELYNRYKNKLSYCCNKFRLIEEPDDMKGDLAYRFLVSVMTYDGRNKFKTYMWTNTKRRFEDYERKNSRVCKNNPVQCQLCGRYSGAITRLHLMNNKIKSKEGFQGHIILHEKIIEDIGKEKFNLMGDKQGKVHKSLKWEGNNYSPRQKKYIKSLIVDAYREMFPNHQLSMNNISIYETDPKTEIEYINMIKSKNEITVKTDGYYVSSKGKIEDNDDGKIFVPYDINNNEKDIYKEYADKITTLMHKKLFNNKKRQKFKNTQNRESLKTFLENVFIFLSNGYSTEDISNLFNYECEEINFWLKKIKKSKELI